MSTTIKYTADHEWVQIEADGSARLATLKR